MSLRLMLLAGAFGMLAAVPAHAADKADFETCDGRIHPGKQNDGMRGEASTYGYSFLPRTRLPNAVVAACSRALGSPRLLPTQTLRRAHLLRARAAAFIEIGDAERAIADLDAAETATASLAGDRFFQRSMGVSFKLLRALALARSGDMAAALPLARSAADARPYALQVQQVAAAIAQAGRPLGSASPSPWPAVSRLAPDASAIALMRDADIGNFAGVLAIEPQVKRTWPTAAISDIGLASPGSGGSGLLSALIVSLHTAYARAATGDPAGARRDLAEVRARIAAARAAPAAGKTGETTIVFGTGWKDIDSYVETRARQIEARIAVAEGRPTDAIGALVASPLPRDATSVELLTALKAKVPAKDAGLVPDAAPYVAAVEESREQQLVSAISGALLAPETPRAVIDYARARPNILGALVGGALSMGTSLLGGISRTDGFSTTNNPDGTIRVEFLGNTPSAALVQEMTLLRAAEVVRAAGKPGFVIAGRRDFTRRLTTSRGGVPLSSVPQGFKTELTIRPVDAGPAGALDAIAIIDALGPLYYEERPAKR